MAGMMLTVQNKDTVDHDVFGTTIAAGKAHSFKTLRQYLTGAAAAAHKAAFQSLIKTGQLEARVSGGEDSLLADMISLLYQSDVEQLETDRTTAPTISRAYYVSKDGDDSNLGTTQAGALLTVGELLRRLPAVADPADPSPINVYFGAGTWDESADDLAIETAASLRLWGTRNVLHTMAAGTVSDVTARRITFTPDPEWTPGDLKGLQFLITAGTGLGTAETPAVGTIYDNGADWIDVSSGWMSLIADPDATTEIIIYRPATLLNLSEYYSVYIKRAGPVMDLVDIELTGTSSPLLADVRVGLYGCRVPDTQSFGALVSDGGMTGCFFDAVPAPLETRAGGYQWSWDLVGCLFTEPASAKEVLLQGRHVISATRFEGIGLKALSMPAMIYAQDTLGGDSVIDGAPYDGLLFEAPGIVELNTIAYGLGIQNCGQFAVHAAKADVSMRGDGGLAGTGNAAGLVAGKGRTINRPSVSCTVTGTNGDTSPDGGGNYVAYGSLPAVDTTNYGKVVG
jgi:hypothetical protein